MTCLNVSNLFFISLKVQLQRAFGEKKHINDINDVFYEFNPAFFRSLHLLIEWICGRYQSVFSRLELHLNVYGVFFFESGITRVLTESWPIEWSINDYIEYFIFFISSFSVKFFFNNKKACKKIWIIFNYQETAKFAKIVVRFQESQNLHLVFGASFVV